MYLSTRPPTGPVLTRVALWLLSRLEMSEHDIKTGKELLEEDFVKANPAWHKELEMMVKSKVKAEIQALSSFGFQYLSKHYLPRKLQEADWI